MSVLPLNSKHPPAYCLWNFSRYQSAGLMAVTVRLLFVLILLQMFYPGPVNAQVENRSEELLIRKIYVPEETPAEWPKGDWRPISTRKFMQLTAPRTERNLQTAAHPIQQAIYESRFEEGRLSAGTFSATIQNPTGQPQWIVLGRTNLPFTTGQWLQTEAQWGTAENGWLYLFHPETGKQFSAQWTCHGQNQGEGYQFDLQLLRAGQTEFHVQVPTGFSMAVSSPPDAAIFKQQISPRLVRWSIVGLEADRLSLRIQPDATNTLPRQTLSRQTHAITHSPAETNLVTDVRLESVSETMQELLIRIPAGIEPELITFQQEPVTNWTVTDAVESAPAGTEQIVNERILKLPLSAMNYSAGEAIAIRIRSRVVHKDYSRLQTHFPIPLGTVQLETLVSLAIVHPLEIQSLVTNGLYQIDTRLVNGVRDVWSYRATSADPVLDVGVQFPQADLGIEQLLRLNTNQQELNVQQLMLWNSPQGGNYGAEFQVHPGYEVINAQLPHSGSSGLKLSWHVLRQNKKNILQIQLPNQLIAGQEIPVAVTLKPKGNPGSGSRLSLPPLTPLTAIVKQTYASNRHILTLNSIPHSGSLRPATEEVLRRWNSLRISELKNSEFAWSDTETFFDLTAVDRFIAETEWEQNKNLPASPVDENPAMLTTELLRQRKHGRIRYQIAIPASQRRRSNSCRLIWNEVLPLLSWRSVNLNTEILSQTTGLLKPNQILVQQKVSGQTSTLHLNWINSRTETDGDILIEAYVPLSMQTGTVLLLPTADSQLTFQGRLLWHENDYSCQQNGSIVAGNRADTQLQWTYAADSNTLSMDQSTVEIDPVTLASGPAENSSAGEPGWVGVATLLQEMRPETPFQTTLDLRCDDSSGWLGSLPFQFTAAVTMKCIELNGQPVAYSQNKNTFELPEMFEPIRHIRLQYQGASEETFCLPAFPSAIQLGTITLLLPRHLEPENNSQILFWREIPSFHSSGSHGLSNEAETEKYASSPVDTIHPLLADRNYRIFMGAINPQPPSTIKVQIHTAQSGLLISLLILLTILIAAGWLMLTFPLPRSFWWWAAGASLLPLLWPGTGMTFNLWPAQVGLLVSALFYDVWFTIRSQLLPEVKDSDQDDVSHPLAILLPSLLKGTTGALFLISITPVSAQIGAEGLLFGRRSEPASQYDVLVPVEAGQLISKFQGLEISHYPDVVYISADLAEALNERTRRSDSLDQILYTQASYDIQLNESGQFQVACLIEMTDPSLEMARRNLILPIRQLESLSSLTAMVNGIPVSISPLADGSGLEIPLPDSDGSSAQDVTDSGSNNAEAVDRLPGAELDIKKSFRKYRIELSFIPQQTANGLPVLVKLEIPPATNSHIHIQSKDHWETRLLDPATKTSIPFPADQPMQNFMVGSVRELPLEFRQIPLTKNSAKTNQPSPAQLRVALFCQLHADYVEHQIRLNVEFAAEAKRELNWQLPERMFVRHALGPDVLDWKMQRSDGPGKNWNIRLAESKASASELLISLIEPFNAQRPVDQLTLPQLLPEKGSSPPELTWLIGVQSFNGEFLQQVEFPQAASSRIPREAFITAWPEPARIREDVQCFQVKKPQLMLLSRDLTPTQFQLDSAHEFQLLSNDSTLELESRMNLVITGPKIWTIPLQIPELWLPRMLKVFVNGREISARLYRVQDSWKVNFSEPLNGPVELQISLSNKSAKLRKGNLLTPPRVSGAIATNERISWSPAENQPEWMLVEKNSAGDVKPITLPYSNILQDAPAPPDYLLAERIQRESVSVEDEQSSSIVRDINTKPQPFADTAETETASETATRKADQITQYSARALLEMTTIDHQLWPAETELFGQTIVSWKQANLSPLSDVQLNLSLPESCEIIALLRGNEFLSPLPGRELSITLQAGKSLKEPLILFWRQSLETNWRFQQIAAVPEFPQISPPQIEWTRHELSATLSIPVRADQKSFTRYSMRFSPPPVNTESFHSAAMYPLWIQPSANQFHRVEAQGNMQKTAGLNWTPAGRIWQLIFQMGTIGWFISMLVYRQRLNDRPVVLNATTLMLIVLLIFAGP